MYPTKDPPRAPNLPRKNVKITIKEKLDVQEKLACKVPFKDIVEDYGIRKSTVRDIQDKGQPKSLQPGSCKAQDVALARELKFEVIDKVVYD